MSQANVQATWIATQNNKEALSKASLNAFINDPNEAIMNSSNDIAMP
ncbi:MAG: hypothetical protein Q9M36_08365 [Sulfurovum sp.]|nr:hypothetical protein [Sulfurovum sp.]